MFWKLKKFLLYKDYFNWYKISNYIYKYVILLV